jgi:hypothetical protein
MRHGRLLRRTACLVLALGLALPGVANAQELVSITQVTFDRFGGLSETGGPQIAVSITCDATGIIGDLDIDAQQRDEFANSNLSLLDAPCTTVPTRYVIPLDCPDCAFVPGPLIVTGATEFPGGAEFGSNQRIILRNRPLF